MMELHWLQNGPDVWVRKCDINLFDGMYVCFNNILAVAISLVEILEGENS